MITVDLKRTVKLTPTVWRNWPDYDEPGNAAIFDPTATGCVLHFACPGCGRWGGIRVGYGTKPDAPGCQSIEAASVQVRASFRSPAIRCCNWHGHLKAGVFTAC